MPNTSWWPPGKPRFDDKVNWTEWRAAVGDTLLGGYATVHPEPEGEPDDSALPLPAVRSDQDDS